MSSVGAIDGAGLAGTSPVGAGCGEACTSADFGAGAAACWTGAGADAGLAASGLAFGIGTVRLATWAGRDARGAAWSGTWACGA